MFFLVPCYFYSLHQDSQLLPRTLYPDIRIPSLLWVEKKMMWNNSHVSLLWLPSWNEVQLFWSNKFLCSTLEVFDIRIPSLARVEKRMTSMTSKQQPKFHIFLFFHVDLIWPHHKTKSNISGLITFFLVRRYFFHYIKTVNSRLELYLSESHLFYWLKRGWCEATVG